MKRAQKIAQAAAAGACGGTCPESARLREEVARLEYLAAERAAQPVQQGRTEADWQALVADRDRLNALERKLRLEVQSLSALIEQSRVV